MENKINKKDIPKQNRSSYSYSNLNNSKPANNNTSNNTETEYMELSDTNNNYTGAVNVSSANKEIEQLAYNNSSILDGFGSKATILYNAKCAGGAK